MIVQEISRHCHHLLWCGPEFLKKIFYSYLKIYMQRKCLQHGKKPKIYSGAFFPNCTTKTMISIVQTHNSSLKHRKLSSSCLCPLIVLARPSSYLHIASCSCHFWSTSTNHFSIVIHISSKNKHQTAKSPLHCKNQVSNVVLIE